jgi:hypothetical protein
MPIHSKVLEASAKGATPLKAVRQHCVGCCGGNTSEPAYCPSTACALWLFRFGRNPTPEERQAVADNYLYPLERGQTGDDVASRTALKSIPAHCFDCAGSRRAVTQCRQVDCDLHPFRFGNGNKRLSPEQRHQAAERLRQARWGNRSPDEDDI